MLTILDLLVKEQGLDFPAAIHNLQNLRAKLESREPASADQKEEKGAIPPSGPFINLLHGLAGKMVDGKLKAVPGVLLGAILQECAQQTAVPVLEILAIQIGRKDSGPEIKAFLALLTQLQEESLEAFARLVTLSEHPPKLGIKKLLKELQSEGQLLDEPALSDKLQSLEIDPHGLGRRPQDDPFDLNRIAQKISEMGDAARCQDDGNPSLLGLTEKQALLDMVNTIEGLGSTVPAFIGKEGQAVPASQLTQAELAQHIAQYRQLLINKGLTEAKKQKILLLAIALMREAMYRGSKHLFADDTQIAAVCNTMVRNTQDMCLTQVDAGQGKTVINAFNTACMWLLYGEARLLTSDSGLAARDLAKNINFFELLGIPVGDKIVTQKSTAADYCRGGVTYTTFGGLELSLQNSCLAGDIEVLIAEKEVGLVIDEVDDAIYDDRTHYRSTRPQIETDTEGENPLAIYYLAMVGDFLSSPEYKTLSETQGSTEGETYQLLQQFLSTLPEAYAPTRIQQETLAQLLQDNPRQLRTWFTSIVRSNAMRENVDFTSMEESRVIDGILVELKRVSPYTTSGRINPEMQFVDQPMLQARKQKETKDLAFLIPQASKTLLSSNNDAVLHRGYARIVGTTATGGSAKEIERLRRRLPLRVNTMPTHQDKKRVDNPAKPCKGQEAHKQAVQAQIRDYLKQDPHAPILILCAHAEQLDSLIKLWVEEVLTEQAEQVKQQTEAKLAEEKQEKQAAEKQAEQKFGQLTLQILRGNEKAAVEKKIGKEAGHLNRVTIATKLATRGFDAVLEKQQETAGLRVLTVTPPLNVRKEIQPRGRAGRRGQPGQSDIVFNEDDLITKSGKKVTSLEALYAENETSDYREWQLSRYLNDTDTALTPGFLKIRAQVLVLPTLKSQWEYTQINLLTDLQEAWEDLKEEQGLAKLWQTDEKAYEAKLVACEEEFLAFATELWNEALEGFMKNCEQFERSQEAEHQQARKRAREQAEKQRPGLESKEASESKAEPAPKIEQEWAKTEAFKNLQAIKDLVKSATLSVDQLKAKIPQEKEPPIQVTPSDEAALAERNSLFSNQAKLCYDLLRDQKATPFPALNALKQQAIDCELKDIASQLGLEMKQSMPVSKQEEEKEQKETSERAKEEKKEEAPAQQEEQQEQEQKQIVQLDSNATLLSACFQELADRLKPKQVETKSSIAHIGEALASASPPALATPALVSREKDEQEYQRLTAIATWSGEQSLQETADVYGAEIAALKIAEKQRLAAEAAARACEAEEAARLEAERRDQQVRTAAQAALDKTTAITPPVKTESFLKKPSTRYWFLFALVCLLGGAALAITGSAASLGLPFVSLAVWGLTTTLSVATLSTPGFWILAGIGAAYGLAAFLLIFGAVKIVEALMRAKQGKAAGTSLQMRPVTSIPRNPNSLKLGQQQGQAYLPAKVQAPGTALPPPPKPGPE